MNIINDWSPGIQVLGSGVNQLLSILGIALIRIVDDKLMFVVHQEWFPDRWNAVVWNRSTTVSVRGDEVPGSTLVETGVKDELGLAQVAWDGTA